MGAVERNNVKVRNKKRLPRQQRVAKQGGQNRTNKAPLGLKPFHPFSLQMRPRPPFGPGRMPPPGMGPLPPPGVRMPPPPPPPLFRARGPPGPPPRMGPRGPMPPMPMRGPRPPLMGPPPLMRPPPMPPMRPRRFPPRLPPPPPQMIPPNKMRQLKNKMGGKKNIKKKSGGQNNFDMASPWVSESIKTEFDRKGILLATAKESQKQEDWDAFREQRSKCEKMFKAAKMEYIGKHPEEDVFKIMAEAAKHLVK